MIVGIDVGGTFTDFVLVEDGRLSVYKRPSTPDEPARAVLDGLAGMGSITAGSGGGAGFPPPPPPRRPLSALPPRRPPPLVPDELRLEVSERLDYRGRVLQPLDAAEAESLLDRLQAEGVESLAVCLLVPVLN